ncbi:sulfatase-like hydrolase/transferase [Marinilactibacillus sp. XAAS-LB27]|uniref:sulfatase-like hydrolase/transferase n=1 Tax=Marinilactibacillus sp. XAAS-LB27 TaxID=3114538 RepID=UPI002E17575D|nr:sulfatase-like hydrolase/transferase [Marinilactibacillus sp. XAAS-LB27]
MKTIMIMFDTLSRNYLPNYSDIDIAVPNFKRLQEHCIIFDKFYGGSMPCMPARRELHTGKYNFLHRSWGPLEPFDFSVFETLNQQGVYTHLITDHSHYWEDGGATYHNRYSSWEGFRGQEGDRWIARSEALPNENKHPMNKQGLSVTQHFANRTKQQSEEEMSTVKTIHAGIDFLKHHQDKDDWFLQVECFDPHEPFYVPDRYRESVSKDEDFVYWPKYQKVDGEKQADGIQEAREEYKALVRMCDHHLGKVLDYLDEANMWEDTMVIINTDHGFLLGEHDWMGKNSSPMYEEIIHIPFYMHVPGYKGGERCDGIAQTIDIAPTLLDYYGLDIPENMEGKSLLSLLDQKVVNHESILFGTNGGQVCIFDGRYVYMRASADESNQPLVNYTMMPTQIRGFMSKDQLREAELVSGNKFSNDVPMLRIKMDNYSNSFAFGHLLFDLKEDPEQNEPLQDEKVEDDMIEKLIGMLDQIEAPEEEYIRLGLK